MAGIELKHIQKAYTVDGRTLPVLKDICLQIPENSITILLGKSGCGKTTLLRLVGDLEEPNGGEIHFAVTHKTAFVFQEPRLMPWLTVWDNTIFGLKKHSYDTGEIQTLLEAVGLDGFQKAYPHQLSGGMRQRVVIAIALSCNPDLLICDEPTTALDVTIQARILQLILNLQKKLGIAVIFITHNLGVVAKIADYVNVMYAGKVVETGKAEDIFFDPRHPYTWGLLSSMPDLTGDKKERLYTIPGNPPNLANEVKGDAFAVRNPYALNIDFEEEPPMFEINEHHQAATWLLHPDAPKVEMPQTLKKRIEQLRREEKRYAETEGAYGTDE